MFCTIRWISDKSVIADYLLSLLHGLNMNKNTILEIKGYFFEYYTEIQNNLVDTSI